MPKVVSITSGDHRARVRARRDELVESHLSLVQGIARRILHAGLPPSFDLEDLVQTGNIALLHAATKYRDDGKTPFACYARPCVRGAILDSVRRKRYTEATMGPLGGLERAAPPQAIDEVIDASRMAERLREAMSWLSADERAVIQRYYGAGEETRRVAGRVVVMPPPTLAQIAQRLRAGGPALRARHAGAINALRARFRVAA